MYNRRPNHNENPTQLGTKADSGVPPDVALGDGSISLVVDSFLDDFLRALSKRWWLILLTALVLTGVAVGISVAMTPKYEASIRILIKQEQVSGESFDPLQSQVEGLQQLTATMVELVNSDPVARTVIQRLGLRMTSTELRTNLEVEQVNGTQVIQVNYTDTSPQRAQQIANAVGDVFSERLSEVSASDNAVTATVWERAKLPEKPVSPNPVLYGLVAFVVGTLLGVALALLLEHLDDNWGSPEELEQISGVPTYGIILQHEFPKSNKKAG